MIKDSSIFLFVRIMSGILNCLFCFSLVLVISISLIENKKWIWDEVTWEILSSFFVLFFSGINLIVVFFPYSFLASSKPTKWYKLCFILNCLVLIASIFLSISILLSPSLPFTRVFEGPVFFIFVPLVTLFLLRLLKQRALDDLKSGNPH